MRTYARIHSGVVVELLHMDGDITIMFHPLLTWIDISSQPEVSHGWCFDGTDFTPPAAVPAAAPALTFAELQAQVTAISAQLTALSGHK